VVSRASSGSAITASIGSNTGTVRSSLYVFRSQMLITYMSCCEHEKACSISTCMTKLAAAKTVNLSNVTNHLSFIVTAYENSCVSDKTCTAQRVHKHVHALHFIVKQVVVKFEFVVRT
jgi:hypothetical protein